MKANTKYVCKKEFVARLEEKTGQPKALVEVVLNGAIDLMTDLATNLEPFYLHGLGTFNIVEYKPRRIYNRYKDKMVEHGAKTRVVFRPAKHLRDI